MTLSVSRRVQRVKPSPTLAVTARAARLKAEGKDVIGLGAGEPDFDTPVHIAQAGIDAINGGFTRYTNVDGINELKDAIIAKFARDNGIQYERPQILVSSGRQADDLTTSAWPSSTRATRPSSRRPTGCPTRTWCCSPTAQPVMPFAGAAQGYKITPRQLAAAITPKTRLVLLNSPCNPTGAAYTRAELRALGEVLLEHPRIVIGTDDMYEKIYLGAGAVLQPADRRAGALRPHRDDQRRIEGLRHDRLAHRLLRRTQGNHHGHGHHPGPVDLERLEHLAEGRDRRARRRPGLRRAR